MYASPNSIKISKTAIPVQSKSLLDFFRFRIAFGIASGPFARLLDLTLLSFVTFSFTGAGVSTTSSTFSCSVASTSAASCSSWGEAAAPDFFFAFFSRTYKTIPYFGNYISME